MKKVKFTAIFTIAIVFSLICAGTAAAQDTEVKKVDSASLMKTIYNARAGVNFSSVGSLRSVFGFHAGVMADIPLALLDIQGDPFVVAVHPGAQFIKKGGSRNYRYYNYALQYYTVKWQLDAYYLEVPVPFSVKKILSEKMTVRADFGPYLAFGLFGSYKVTGNTSPTQDIDNESSFDYLSRFDAGLMYGGVLELSNKYSIGLHSSQGLSDDDIFTLYITFGYKL